MFQAYGDESVAAGQVLVLGAVVARPARWEEFSNKWQERLDHARWDFFKMSEVWNRGGDESLEHAKWHYFTMRDYVQGAIAVVVPIEPLERAVEYFELPALRNPYIWAFKSLLDNTAINQREWEVDEPIDFIFDERGEQKQIYEAWDVHKAFMPPEQREISGRKPIFEDDKRVLPLQAADMWVWWCRKKCLEDGTLINRDFPIPWGGFDDMGAMFFEWTEAELRREFSIIRAAMEAGGLVRPLS